ncbi:MAG: nucleotidyl transferase AbiEii/AbiGii toxin family protein [Prevotellaceae bacterium]|jgi:hypothetical protein|nr:nucleotidyl transferase AbiEii/AbiGii toxin family protein [Prevotellaceae bacterium]
MMSSIEGLSPHAAAIFEGVSRLNSIKEYVLMGGTALALQLRHRLSEDLDFCKWHKKGEKIAVNWPEVEQELATLGEVKKDLLSMSQCDFYVSGVKITFLADNNFTAPSCLRRQLFLNNLAIIDLITIGAMKLDVMSRRNAYRDFYDFYAILKSGVALDDLIANAGLYTRHTLRTKDMVSMLLSVAELSIPQDFDRLNPIYRVTPQEIQRYMIEKVQIFLKNTGREKKFSIKER